MGKVRLVYLGFSCLPEFSGRNLGNMDVQFKKNYMPNFLFVEFKDLLTFTT